MKTAFLFPGQGIQYSGMAQDLYNASSHIVHLFEQASTICNKDMAHLLFNSSESELKNTENTQIAMTLANIASAVTIQNYGLHPNYVAGFSVGEYSALYIAGVLSIDDVFAVTQMRGNLMEKYSRKADNSNGPAGMSAIIGLDFDTVANVIKTIPTKQVFIANHSSPIQIVIAGTADGLQEAEALLEQADAMKIIRLNVSGPFHTPLLYDAAQEFSDFLHNIPFNDPLIPIYSNVTGQEITNGAQARTLASQQIYSTVQWVQCEKTLFAQNPQQILEVGPGKVLTSLWKSFNRTIKVKPSGTLDAIQSLLIKKDAL